MQIYISPRGIPHVTIEPNGKRHHFWPLLGKLQELSKTMPGKRAFTQVPQDPTPEQQAILNADYAADYAADESKVSVNGGVVERTVHQEGPLITGRPMKEPTV